MTFRYPTLSNPTPYAEFLQVNNEHFGCAPVNWGPYHAILLSGHMNLGNHDRRLCHRGKGRPYQHPSWMYVIWDFDADNPGSEQKVGDIGQRNHTYGEPGTYRVRVSVQCGSCLKSDDKLINIEKCKGKESTGCGILRIATAVALAMVLLAGLLAICIPQAAYPLLIAAAVMAVIGVITGIAYSLFCPDKPCAVAF